MTQIQLNHVRAIQNYNAQANALTDEIAEIVKYISNEKLAERGTQAIRAIRELLDTVEGLAVLTIKIGS